MQTVLITGASRGIGRELAIRFADENTKLILVSRDETELEKTCQAAAKKGATTVPVIADLSKLQSAISIIEQIDFSHIDVLINNAGIAIVEPLEKLSLENWQKTFDVNVTAPFLLIQKLHTKMPKGSSIVNVASIASREGFPNWSSYCMSKSALDGFIRSIREELSPKGIRIINVYPGAVSTDIWKNVPGDQNLERMMKPEAIADMVFNAVSQPFGTVVENITVRNLNDI